MKTLTKLSARTLEHYINIRRWRTDLEFFDTEVGFFTRLVNDLEAVVPDLAGTTTNKGIVNKMSGLIHDKNKVIQLVNNQLDNLEMVAEGLLIEDVEELGGKQANIEYQVHDLVNELRDLKKSFFGAVGKILDKQKQLVN